ncbi:MAG TPA: hypothetical protein VLV87_07660 [Gammaproteobacteria bacterium]|nr:hypothetical protein [Gammaproteobacteria bacterium]
MFARSLLRLRRLAALFLLLAPLAANAETGISIGYTGQHDAQRGQVYMLDWVPEGSSWDLTAGAIRGTQTRDTSWVAVGYEIVDQHLYASFGPALIRHQTSTLTSQYQFMTTFGYHHDDDWFLAVRHLSNGGLRGANIGETVVVLGMDF